MARLKAAWEAALASLWFIPGLLTLTGVALAVLAIEFGDWLLAGREPTDFWWMFGGTPEGARGVLGAIAGSIITVTGVVFSVTIVALQLASTQFTPRVLRQFMSDRPNQVVLGVFIGTFAYALIVQRTIRSEFQDSRGYVPALAVAGAVVLALVSIGFLVFFIDHMARSIQAESVIDRVTRDTLRTIERQRGRVGDGQSEPAAVVPEDPPSVLRATDAGYVQHIEERDLVSAAAERSIVIRVEKRAGEFAYPGEPLYSVWPAWALDESTASALRRTIVLGSARTPYQDIELGLVELMDIAVKALSPGINDPTTAMIAVDRLGEIILAMSREQFVRAVRAGDRGSVFLRRLEFDRAVDIAFNQIRVYGVRNPSMAMKLVNTIGAVARLAPEQRRGPLHAAIHAIGRHAERVLEEPADREAVMHTAGAALQPRSSGSPGAEA